VLCTQIELFTRQHLTKLLITLLLEALEPDPLIHHQYVETGATAVPSSGRFHDRPPSTTML
jgi:hypothetical protein